MNQNLARQDKLGDILLLAGRLDRDTLRENLAKQSKIREEQGKHYRLGHILLQADIINSHDLRWALEKQVSKRDPIQGAARAMLTKEDLDIEATATEKILLKMRKTVWASMISRVMRFFEMIAKKLKLK